MNVLPKLILTPARLASALAASNKKPFLGVVLVIGTACAAHAQSILADAQISGQPLGGGSYNYTITLHNNDSTSPIQTFWYGWFPGANFLPSSPTSIQAPAGWVGFATGGGLYDGYSVEFYTFSAPLNPGGSLNFGFVSSDPPQALAGDSPWYPGYQVGISYVYSGYLSGNAAEFVVQSVPEPSSLGLLLAASLGLLLARRRSC